MVGDERLELSITLYFSITYTAFCNHVTDLKMDLLSRKTLTENPPVCTGGFIVIV